MRKIKTEIIFYCINLKLIIVSEFNDIQMKSYRNKNETKFNYKKI